MTHRKLLLLMLLAAARATAQVDDASSIQQRENAERERIRQTRTAAQEQFALQEAQCYRLFAVNDCLIKVHRARRELLGDLRRQDLSLNDAQRKRRAAEQLLRSDEKAPRAP